MGQISKVKEKRKLSGWGCNSWTDFYGSIVFAMQVFSPNLLNSISTRSRTHQLISEPETSINFRAWNIDSGSLIQCSNDRWGACSIYPKTPDESLTISNQVRLVADELVICPYFQSCIQYDPKQRISHCYLSPTSFGPRKNKWRGENTHWSVSVQIPGAG